MPYNASSGYCSISDDYDYIFYTLGTCFAVTDVYEPNTYDEEATTGPDSSKWIGAMGEEHEALVSNDTWELIPAPADTNVIKCRWVYKIKRNESGEIVRYKARLVAKGFTQQHGVDFFETFAPVAKVQSIRTIFFIASQLDCSMAQFDIPNAYVKAPVDEDIYIQQPQGFVDSDFPEHVLKLKKALYGLKQAGKN